MALGDSFGQNAADGFLTQALEDARRPIRQFVGSLPDLPDPYGTGGRFGDPFRGNIFLGSLIPSGGDLASLFLPGPSTLPRGIAQARGMAVPTQSGPTPITGISGPIARAQQAATAQTTAAAAPGLHSANLQSLFQQIGQEEGVPWEYLAALADTENSAADAVSPAGARGIMQVVPGQGFDLPGEDWRDAATSIRQGARALKAKYKATGSWDAAIGAYFGYGTDAGGQTTDNYSRIAQAHLARIRKQAAERAAAQPDAPQALPKPPAGVKPLAGLTVDQYGSESLATGAADYICGPIAAQAFARSQGRNPTLQEALDLARAQGLIDPDRGMHGIDSTVQLIRSLGGAATTGPADKTRIISEIQAGRPVILNTPLHYFVVEGYDPATGRFDLGASARNLRSSGRNQWYTLEEMANLTIGTAKVGMPRGAIYAGY